MGNLIAPAAALAGVRTIAFLVEDSMALVLWAAAYTGGTSAYAGGWSVDTGSVRGEGSSDHGLAPPPWSRFRVVSARFPVTHGDLDGSNSCVYTNAYTILELEWDPAKSERNVRLRALGFGAAAEIFESDALIRLDARRDYGEPRWIAIGRSVDLTLTVVFTDRIRSDGRPVRRIISARRSNRREREAHEAHLSR